MLDDSNPGTFYSLRALSQIVVEHRKPLVLWIGAGVSCWRGFPTWKALAETFHKTFSKFTAEYGREAATSFLDARDYPALFQLCRDTDERRYFSLLGDLLKPRRTTPVYVRFVESLRALEPIRIITTNVDESLETSMEAVTTLQRSDIARSIDLVRRGDPFVIKVHGSHSQLQSCVFTTCDYRELLQDNNYLDLIKHLFTETQAANDKLKGLLIAEGAIARLTPAIWNNTAFAKEATPLW